MNAANEVAVASFLRGEIKFTQIPQVIEKTLEKCNFVAAPTVEDIFSTDKQSKERAQEVLTQIR